jgi:hypothetical protein
LPTAAGQNLVFMGAGDGTFLPRVTNASAAFNRPLAAGDFNGDGYADLATADGTSKNP